MSGTKLFIMIMLVMPVYGLLIYEYKFHKESLLFGRRWMYKEEPELSEYAINFHKRTSLISIIVLTLLVVLGVYRSL